MDRDAGPQPDGSVTDGSRMDGAGVDGSISDAAGAVDAAGVEDGSVVETRDAAVPGDAAVETDGSVVETRDAAVPGDAAVETDGGVVEDRDAGALDGSTEDAGGADAAVTDAGLPVPEGCPTEPTLPDWVAAEPDGRTFTATAGNVSLRVQVVDNGIVRLRYQGTLPTGPQRSWAVQNASGTVSRLNVGSRNGALALCTPELSVMVDAQLHLQARDASGLSLLSDGPAGGFSEDAIAKTRTLTRSVEPSERFYGLGERTGTNLDKRGGTYTFWNTDAYVDSVGGYPANADPLYQSIPLLIGLRGTTAYGLFTDNPYRMVVDLAHTHPNTMQFRANGGAMDQYLVAGPSLATVLTRYTFLTGRMPLPPRWALGFHQSRWGYPNAARVVEVMDTFRARNIPADSIWLDIQHMDGFRSFTFDPVNYANPDQLVSNAAERGFRTLIIVDPGIKQDPAWDIYQQGVTGQHFLRNEDGTPYVGEVWPGAACFPDFTRAETRTWWTTLLARATNLGIAGIWIDMNEPSDFTTGTVPNHLLVDGDGIPTTMAEVHNVYALNMARATRDGLQTLKPGHRPFVLTRAGYAGIQRHAAVWTGDAPSTWATLDMTLPMMLNMGLSGVSFVGSDVGGYSGNGTPEMFARWMQLGSISPFFRDHVTRDVADQEPWAFGVEVEYISRTVMGERYRLLPYLYSVFEESTRTGAPVLRPMVWEFQEDATCAGIGDQAMLGPWLLYAPVTAQGQSSRRIYLPAGRWFDDRSNAIHDGPGFVELDVRLESLPALVREGAILPHAQGMAFSDQHPINPLQLDVYPAEHPTSWTLYEDEGDGNGYQQGAYRRVTYELRATPTGAVLEARAPEGTHVPSARTLLVRVRRVDHEPTGVFLDNTALTPCADLASLNQTESGWWFDRSDLGVWVAFPDRAPFSLELRYDRSINDPAPLVRVPLSVRVPADTPAGSTIHVAHSPGWHHVPLSWGPGMTEAHGEIQVPRGQWFEYKYSRGDWSTVEKWSGCQEAANRYAYGAAHPGKQDFVDMWADRCK